MPPKNKEPTRAQLSSRLSYSHNTPAFIQKLQNRIAGVPDDDDEDEFEDDGSGRPPIPRRPAIPERPASQAGSEDEDDLDEKPQVVVLRQGKHLTQREAENIRRQEKGLAPIIDTPFPPANEKQAKSAPTLSFSSSKLHPGTSKRKRVVVSTESDHDNSVKGPSNKKSKKNSKLLSFGDDA